MTQVLDNFVSGVARDANKEARKLLVNALGLQEAWVQAYVAKLGDKPVRDKLVAGLKADTAELHELAGALADEVGTRPTLVTTLAVNTNWVPAYAKNLDDAAARSALVSGLVIDSAAQAVLGKLTDDLGGNSTARPTLVTTLAARTDWTNEYAKNLNNDTPRGNLVAGLVIDPAAQAVLGKLTGDLAGNSTARPIMVGALATRADWVASYVDVLVHDTGVPGEQWSAAADKLAVELNTRSTADIDRPLEAFLDKTKVRAEVAKLLPAALGNDKNSLDLLFGTAFVLQSGQPTVTAMAFAASMLTADLQPVDPGTAGSGRSQVALIKVLNGSHDHGKLRAKFVAAVKDLGAGNPLFDDLKAALA
jgi:hypothetical protein